MPILFVLIWLAILNPKRQSGQLRWAWKLVAWWLITCVLVSLVAGYLTIVLGLGENMPGSIGMLASFVYAILSAAYVGIVPALILAYWIQRKSDKTASNRAHTKDAPVD